MDQKSAEKVYGRKIVRDGQGIRHTKKNYAKRFFLIMGCTFILGFLFGSIVTGIIVHKNDMKKLMQRQETVSGAEAQMIQSSPYGSGNNVITDDGQFHWETDDSFIPLDVNMDRDLQQFVYELSAAYNMDWTLVMAIISHESEFVPTAISATNDYGLLQINICNHEMLQERLGITDYLDEEQNIRAGMYVLAYLFKKYDGNTHEVLMAYNMGENGAERLWNSGVHSTSYSRTITEIQAQFQQQIEERIGETNE